jgi:plastocyanin
MRSSMPLSLHKAARQALFLAATVVALAVPCAPAFAGTTLTIVLPDEERRVVNVETDLGAPDIDTTYMMRRSKNSDAKPKTVKGWALSTVFATVNATRGFKEVKLGETGQITVTEDQLNDVPPPALYVENGNVMFIRRSNGPKDFNTVQNIDISSSEIVQTSESSLKVFPHIKSKAEAGDTLEFDVDTSGGGTGKQYSYEWDFDDGKTTEGKQVEHNYAEAGTYDVQVTITSPDSEGDTIEEAVAHRKVNVGEPKKKSEDDRSGGGTNNAGGAPASGTYDGSPGAGSSTGDSSSTTPYSPAPSPTTPNPFDTITSDKDKPLEPGEQVSGTLLASVNSPADDATASAARAARTGNPDFEVPESDDPVPPAAWAGLGALLFMGAGAGLESGRRPRLRRRGVRFSAVRR